MPTCGRARSLLFYIRMYVNLCVCMNKMYVGVRNGKEVEEQSGDDWKEQQSMTANLDVRHM